MSMLVKEIAVAINGVVEGDENVEIISMASLQEAMPGDISFLSNPRYNAAVATSKASAIIVNRDWDGKSGAVIIRVDNADEAFSKLATFLLPAPELPPPGIHPTAVIGKDVKLGEDIAIGPNVVIADEAEIGARTVIEAGSYIGAKSILGKECLIYPNVTIRERVTIGDRFIAHPGAVIGSDGFGYVQDGEKWVKIPQLGTVEIGNDVEIGACTTVDRARFGKTVIENGVKLDNQVQIAHNVRVGENSALVSFVALAGSSSIGRNVRMTGYSAIAGHVHIGDYSFLMPRSGVTKNLAPKSVYAGFPARPFMEHQRALAASMKLPELIKKVKTLEKKIAELEESKS